MDAPARDFAADALLRLAADANVANVATAALFPVVVAEQQPLAANPLPHHVANQHQLLAAANQHHAAVLARVACWHAFALVVAQALRIAANQLRPAVHPHPHVVVAPQSSQLVAPAVAQELSLKQLQSKQLQLKQLQLKQLQLLRPPLPPKLRFAL